MASLANISKPPIRREGHFDVTFSPDNISKPPIRREGFSGHLHQPFSLSKPPIRREGDRVSQVRGR